ncbi:GNAT family N-acetyltransferase [Streptomyces sp. NPDC000594]|uniref:GNAT family N-acetyltransferase n=1 Tax=Streptomyces sp. NPDC000594 TaxID=3154261 RepID=UPI0033275AC7
MADPDGGPLLDDSASPEVCRAVLAPAFAREPATRWICGDSRAVRERWFAATLATQATLPGGRRTVLGGASGEPVAAAVLTPPHTEPSLRARASWALGTVRHCGPTATARTLRYLRAAEPQAPPGAWTLEFLGVLPEQRGRGSARLLLDHVLDTLPAPGGVFLTTADPANETLYHRFGFLTLRHLTTGPLTIAAMLRPGAATGDTA